jgi:hypothetical protein
VFVSSNITVVKPTAISAPVSFNEGESRYLLESDYADAEAAIQAFVAEHGAGATRVFLWEEEGRVNFGFLTEVSGVVENHYLSIEVG